MVGLEFVRWARARTRKRLVAIGGIDAGNLAEVLEAGADAAVVLGAVCKGARDDRRQLPPAADAAAGAADAGMRIYLTGFMGCGKTTVGRALARRLGVPFVDLDEEIERRRG